MLRADFTMDETYYDKTGIVLHAPIAAFGGEKDGEADESAICEWGKYTDNDFDYRIFPGGPAGNKRWRLNGMERRNFWRQANFVSVKMRYIYGASAGRK